MAKVLISVGTLSRGGKVLVTSGGVKYAVFVNADVLEIWKNIDTTPTLADSDTSTTIHGAAAIGYIDAVMDGNDDIHIVSSCTTDQTRDIAYAIFDCATDTLGAWEQAAPYANAPTGYYEGPPISLDSNGKPRVLWVDFVKTKGVVYAQIKYTDKTGASWLTPELVCGNTAKNYGTPKITVVPNNDVEAFYHCYTDSDPTYRRRNATWGTEAAYVETAAISEAVVSTTGDVVYRLHIEGTSPYDIEENNVDTGYDAKDFGAWMADEALVGTTRYIFYIDTSSDVHYIKNSGAGWVDGGVLQVGNCYRVITGWQYNFNNWGTQIGYIFDADAYVYYDALSLAAVKSDPGVFSALRMVSRNTLLRR